MIICPKCGFEQDGGSECRRCGIIFERYRVPKESLPPSQVSAEESTSPGLFVSFYRVFRWVVLAGAVVVVVLILRPSPPPRVDTDPLVAQRVRSKLDQLQRARRAGEPHTLRLEGAEVNSWLGSNLALASGDKSPTQREDAAGAEPTIDEVRSSMRDVRIDLVGDRLRAYVVFDFHGKDLSLLLEGRLRVQDGYLRFEPTDGQLGSLPLPQTVLDTAVRRLFNSAENREKFHLPPELADIHIENSELVISYK